MSVRKKAKGYRPCIDFRYLDKTSLKNKYHFPKINHTLLRVEGSNKLSSLGSVSDYNQVIILPTDQHKATFKEPWGTYMFDQMPSELKSVEDTFQRAMAHVLSYFTMLYLDDIIIYLKLLKHT